MTNTMTIVCNKYSVSTIFNQLPGEWNVCNLHVSCMCVESLNHNLQLQKKRLPNDTPPPLYKLIGLKLDWSFSVQFAYNWLQAAGNSLEIH